MNCVCRMLRGDEKLLKYTSEFFREKIPLSTAQRSWEGNSKIDVEPRSIMSNDFRL